MTLLNALGIDYTSSDKPRINGLVVTARRKLPKSGTNRVNLFARVPDWKISACKSSKQLADTYGYEVETGVKRLFCSVHSRYSNSQGLRLRVNHAEGTLDEFADTSTGPVVVVRWSLEDLRKRLAATHPESMWVEANVAQRDGVEHFHYRKAVYCGPPYLERLESLLEEGTVTVDHLIEVRNRSATERGPLFKIAPSNIPLLFPAGGIHDLLSM
jgi:hypothetical protein